MKILMFIVSKFPFKDSTANRVFGIAKSLKLLNNEVFVTTIDNPTSEKNVDGIDILPLYGTKKSKINKLFDRLFVSRFIKRNKLINKIDAVYFSYRSISLFSIIYLKIHKIKIISDAMEFHSIYAKEFFKKIIFNFRTIFLIPFTKNIICISKSFYFLYKNKNKLLLYPQVDVSKFNNAIKINNDKITLFSGGVGDNKDYIWVLIAFFCEHPMYFDYFSLNIVGTSKNDLVNHIRKYKNSKALDRINFYGFLEKTIFLNMLYSSDFSCLLRPNKRYAKYGFPSKVPESLAAGIPMLCNYTSDLKIVLEDGKDSIIVEKCTFEGIQNALDRIINMSRNDIAIMKNNARAKAAIFDYSNELKLKEIRNFLRNLK